MGEKLKPRERVVPIIKPLGYDPERLRDIARTHLFADDTRTLVIKSDVRKVPWRWSSDTLRNMPLSQQDREKVVGLVAFQLSQSRRAFVIAPISS